MATIISWHLKALSDICSRLSDMGHLTARINVLHNYESAEWSTNKAWEVRAGLCNPTDLLCVFFSAFRGSSRALSNSPRFFPVIGFGWCEVIARSTSRRTPLLWSTPRGVHHSSFPHLPFGGHKYPLSIEFHRCYQRETSNLNNVIQRPRVSASLLKTRIIQAYHLKGHCAGTKTCNIESR